MLLLRGIEQNPPLAGCKVDHAAIFAPAAVVERPEAMTEAIRNIGSEEPVVTARVEVPTIDKELELVFRSSCRNRVSV